MGVPTLRLCRWHIFAIKFARWGERPRPISEAKLRCLAWGFAIDTRYAVGILALGSAVRYDDGAPRLVRSAKKQFGTMMLQALFRKRGRPRNARR